MNQNKTKPFYHFDINSTTDCNLRCTYCIEHEWFKKPACTPDNQLKQKIKDQTQSMLLSDKFMSKFGGIGFFFWGGEPTLNPEFIIDLIEEFSDEPRVCFFIYSNGLNISKIKPILQKYKEYKAVNNQPKVVIQISYDGLASHNISRLMVNGKGSASKVLSTIKELHNDKIPFTIKSTISFEALNCISDNYLEFSELSREIPQFQEYNPTIDYLSDHNFTKEQTDEHFSILKQQVQNIIKNEIDYFKNNNKFRFGWLNPSKAICGAGVGLSMIDTNGDILVCHGALYEKNRDEHLLSNINNETFIDDLLKASKNYEEVRFNLPEECTTCYAHYCMKCNVKKTSISEKINYFDKWVDYDNQKHICGLYKFKGMFRISIMKIIGG